MLKTGKLSDWCIVVTGGAGFLGAKLVQQLAKEGAKVIAVDQAYAGREQSPDSQVTKIAAQLPRDFGLLSSLVRRCAGRYLALFHMAGISNVGQCQQAPVSAFEANVTLTQNVLEFCRSHNITRFIFPSTGLVYGDELGTAAVETDPVRPVNIYAASKIAAEALIRGYSTSYHLQGIIVRLSNVYGANSSDDTVMGAVIQQVKNSESIRLRNLRPVRDFIFVDDVITGMIKLVLADAALPGQIVNLSTGMGTSIECLAKTACRLVGRDPQAIEQATNETTKQSSLVLDNSLLSDITGWKPKHLLNAGLSIILKSREAYELC